MFTFKHIVVFFVLQNTVFSYSHQLSTEDCSSYESNEPLSRAESTDYESDDRSQVCPEKDQSLMSQSDIQYLIEDKMETLKIKEKVNNSYIEAQEMYTKEIEEFLKNILERPEHLLEMLEDIAVKRQKLDTVVELIAAKLEEQTKNENAYNDAENRSVIMLNELNEYTQMCEMNCGNHSIQNRFGDDIGRNSSSDESAESFCVRLKDLNDYIYKKLSEIQPKNFENINQYLEQFENKIAVFKNNLIIAAVKQFGSTMYEVLSIQDDYRHFVKHFNYTKISSEIYHLKENTNEIKIRLNEMEPHLEKFKQHCMYCNTSERIKRNVFDSLDASDVVEVKTTDGYTDVVDEIINTTLKQIETNITTMIMELDKMIDPKMIESYVSKLYPIQNEIENKIKIQEEASYRLRNRILQASIDKIFALSKRSKHMIQGLEKAKQFIKKIIPTI